MCYVCRSRSRSSPEIFLIFSQILHLCCIKGLVKELLNNNPKYDHFSFVIKKTFFFENCKNNYILRENIVGLYGASTLIPVWSNINATYFL